MLPIFEKSESTQKIGQPTQKREVKQAEKHEKQVACQPVIETQKTRYGVEEFDTPTTIKSWHDRMEADINSGILGDFKTTSRLSDIKMSRFSYMLAQPGENKNEFSSQLDCQELQIDLEQSQGGVCDFLGGRNELSDLQPKKIDFLTDQQPVDEEIELSSSSLEILSKWSDSD